MAMFPQSYIYQIVKEKYLNCKKGWEIFGWSTDSFVVSCKDLFAYVLGSQTDFTGQCLMTYGDRGQWSSEVFILTSFPLKWD